MKSETFCILEHPIFVFIRNMDDILNIILFFFDLILLSSTPEWNLSWWLLNLSFRILLIRLIFRNSLFIIQVLDDPTDLWITLQALFLQRWNPKETLLKLSWLIKMKRQNKRTLMLELHSTLKHTKINSMILRSVGSSRICRMKKEFLSINLINMIRKLRSSKHLGRFHSGVEERRIRSKKKRMMFKMSSMFLINTKIGSLRMQNISLFIVLLHNAMERTSET